MDDDSIVMRFGLEGKVDEKQIKQEIDKAQKVANTGEVKIPTKTQEVDPKNIKQEVKSVQKVADKTPVKMAVELPDNLKTLMKEYKAEIKSLSQLKKNPSEKKTKKLLDYDNQYAKLRKKYKDDDAVKEFDKFLDSSEMPKIRIQAKKTAEAQEKALKEQEKIANEQIKEAKQQKGKSTSTTTDNKTKLKEEKQKIIDDVNKERAKQTTAQQNIQNAHVKKQKTTEFVEGRIEDKQLKPGMKQIYENILVDIERYKNLIMTHTDNGQNKKAMSFWGNPKDYDKFISIFQGYIDKGVADYNNRDEFVPKAKKEYEDITKNLEALEAESVKRLEEINKLLGPIEKISIDPSKLTPKHYQDLFKEPLPPQKFKLKRRTLTDDVADAAINREELRKLRKGNSRGKGSVPGADTQIGMRQSIMDGPYVDTKRIIRTAIGGPYADTNSYVRNAIETQKASYKLAKETLEQFRVAANKLQEFLNQRNAEVNAKAETEGRMAIAGKGRNKNEITEQEKNAHLSQISTELAAKEAKKISKGSPTADVKVFEETLKASFGFLTKSFGPSIWKPLEQNINRILANFAGGTFKITDDPIKGEGKNYAELAKLLSENFKDINEFFKQNPEMEQLAEATRQLKAAANINEDVFNQTLKSFDKFLRKFGYNPGRIPTTGEGTGTRNTKEPPSSGNTMFAREIAETNKNLEKNTTFTKIGNLVQEENAETNKLNANTGTDSEAGKDEIVEATKDIGTTIEKTFPFGNGGNGGNGGNNSGGGGLGDTGPSILEQIRDTLNSINLYTTAIFDLLPKLKLTIKREKRSKKKDEFIPETEPNPSLYPVVAGELKDLSPRTTSVWADATRPKKYNEFSEEFKEREKLDAIRKKLFSKSYNNEEVVKRIENILSTPTGESRVKISKDISEVGKNFGDMIKKAFGVATKTTEVDRIKNLNQTQREKELAELIKTYGIADRDRNATSTGDKGRAFRMKSVYGYRQKNTNPFKDLKLTPGLEIDTKGITDALQTMIEKNMFSAQTGVNSFADLIKLSFGGIGMPSLEKSRAQAEAANEILSVIRQTVLELLQAIQGNETTLRGFEASGDAKFNDEGRMVSGSDDAWTIFGQLEEQKSVLNGLIAELTKMDQLSAETGENMTEFFKVLGFVSPELRKCNVIIGNINAGLDKNGKALKFQKRIQETLNYSFQLLTRHIGQMIKGWLLMLNPINLIKKAFSDFASYDVKWQRTMNVIKYNFRRIIKPAVEWIAQQLVNMIGLANALIKGIGSAFGKNWDLFDKDAANAEKIHEELEAASNVSAGFDELHDIGSDNTGANDLSGDIYTPQWDGLNSILETVGKTIGNIIDAVSHFTFWDWLKLAGAALLGFVALKALINWFGKGKNPLQSVADGLSFLEKAVGWAILILAVTEFTKALTGFIECMKTADWEDIVKSLLMLAGAFTELFLTTGGLLYLSSALSISAPSIAAIGAVVGGLALFTMTLTDFIECMKSASWEDIVKSLLMLAGAFDVLVLTGGGLMLIASALGMLAPQMLGLAVVIAAFAPVIWALSAFVEAIKGLTTGDVLNGLLLLAGAFMAIAISIGVLLVVLSTAIASGVGALAILSLAGVLVVISLVILSLAELVRALGEAGEGIKLICEGIKAVLQPVIDLIDSIIGKVTELATTIVKEVGETIRTVIKTVGDVILGVIDRIVNAIPNLLQSIVNFCYNIGPAIENSVDAICRSITKLVNFVVSAVEYMANLIIGTINKISIQVPDWVPGIGGQKWGFNLGKIDIPRFVPKYEQGTNYVPNDGLAYLHQGEAVIPKKYNQPYQQNSMSAEEIAYMKKMMNTLSSLDNTMKQGIPVSGQFVQRGSDLVAVVNKTKSQSGADLLSNVSYAR